MLSGLDVEFSRTCGMADAGWVLSKFHKDVAECFKCRGRRQTQEIAFPDVIRVPWITRWLASSPLDANVDADSLVMTFSNVNPDVVQLNAEALGMATFTDFVAIKFGRLHSLVGLRNNIGHGGTLAPPANSEFTDLWGFTEQLIEDYSETFKSWLLVRFAPPPPPPSKIWRIGKIVRELIGAIFSIL